MPESSAAADPHDVMTVVGARENNLRNVDVTIPKRRLTVFTGVSGSGKSSLVFRTIAAESRRLVDETYSSFLQGFMPSPGRPDVDRLDGLTAAVVVDQARLGANPRSTVGTVTDVNALLRVLFSRLAIPSLGTPRAYAFNVASASGSGSLKKADGSRVVRTFEVVGGMCVRCEGRGSVSDVDVDELFDPAKSLNENALKVPGMSMDGWYGRIFAGSKLFDMDKPLGQYSRRELDNLLTKEATRITVDGSKLTYEGLIPRIRRSMLSKDPDTLQPHVRAFVERAVVFTTCPDCEGTRLTEEVRSSRIGEHSIADVCRWQITEVAAWLRTIEEPTVAPLVGRLLEMLDAFVTIGLGYVSLDRPSGTLSGGESQRVKLLRHLGSALTDVTYVFDEPTAGLHPHDIARMNNLLLKLRDKGNTVLVVEHEPETIAVADHVVDLGPGAGRSGGEVTFTGTVAELAASDTVTGRHLADRGRLRDEVRTPSGVVELRGLTRHNLVDVDVDVPLGVLTVVTGVAGSGKSSLLDAGLNRREDVVVIGQEPIKGSRRSNPATYTGLLDPIRKAFANAWGVKPSLFSANSEGACGACGGTGVVFTDLGPADTLETPCDVCGGLRYTPDVLEYTLADRSIAEVLAMSSA